MWVEGDGATFHEVRPAELRQVARQFLKLAGGCQVWLFFGEMGSGKTTFIKAICSELGVTGVMSSPTFSIVNEYEATGGKKIRHFDFYRIKNETEAYDIGTEEYLDSGEMCLIEWPEKIPSFVPPTHAEVTIAVVNQNERTIALSVHDGKEKKRI